MSDKAERLQDAIGLIKDEYVEEAHGKTLTVVEDGDNEALIPTADSNARLFASSDTSQGSTNDTANAASVTATDAATILQMQPRKRRPWKKGPIAIAACLAIVLGVGALTFANMPSPKAELVEDSAMEEPETLKMDSESMVMEGSATDALGAEGAATASEADGERLYYAPEPPGPNGHGQGNRINGGEAYVLTAGEWNDNDNWSFFMNLVNQQIIGFPVFGLDPTNRVKATVVNGNGDPIRGEDVVLLDAYGQELWHGVTDKSGNAYLFFRNGQIPATASAGGVSEHLLVTVDEQYSQQNGKSHVQSIADVILVVNAQPSKSADTQVMFIVDTTGSMGDELNYLKKDFAAIAGDVGNQGIEYSVNFYRDKGDAYVTKCNGFTNNVQEVQQLLNNEYADGGGDAPEAVADILDATITHNGSWRDDCNKIAFLIFDAPPHEGYNNMLDAAIRSAAEQGIRLVPVVASNADRDTELFGRALAIMSGSTYVFLTDDSGVGDSHLEPIIGNYSVELLHDIIVRIINDNR